MNGKVIICYDMLCQFSAGYDMLDEVLSW